MFGQGLIASVDKTSLENLQLSLALFFLVCVITSNDTRVSGCCNWLSGLKGDTGKVLFQLSLHQGARIPCLASRAVWLPATFYCLHTTLTKNPTELFGVLGLPKVDSELPWICWSTFYCDSERWFRGVGLFVHQLKRDFFLEWLCCYLIFCRWCNLQRIGWSQISFIGKKHCYLFIIKKDWSPWYNQSLAISQPNIRIF